MKAEIKHISDELLARYLSGKATPEEESAVLDYMSENDERLDDLLAMSAAISLPFGQKSGKSRKLLPPTAGCPGTGSKESRRPLWPAISMAASLALLIGVGIALWHNSSDNISIDPAPTYAVQDSIVETNMEDTL